MGKGKSKSTEGSKQSVKRRVPQGNSCGSDNENESLEWYCIMSCDSFSNWQRREQWIEFTLCKNWVHIHSYVCLYCNSDDEDSE